ncbi:MAG: NTP transferase domain-containing protein [Methylococcus sp.]
MTTVVGLLLAAGFSRRFGANKLLQALSPMTCVASQACATLRGGVDHVLAIIRPGQPELASILTEAGAEVIVFHEAEQGMGATLAHGVRASRWADAWVVALADMPWIRPETVRSVTQALKSGAPLVAPEHVHRRGHPVGFGAGFLEELLTLRGDQGAKSILDRHARRIHHLPCDDPGIHRDIDCLADLDSPDHPHHPKEWQ